MLGQQSETYELMVKECLENRQLLLNTEVTPDVLEDIVLYIMKWNREDKDIIPNKRKPIWLYINSNGGDVISGFNLIDTILASTTPVYGVAFGCAASMAGYILMACHKRFCFKNTVILIHDGEASASSSGSKMKDIMKFYESLDARIKDFVLKQTDITEEFYETIKEKEYYMYGSDEGISLGIVDEVIASLGELL